MKCSLLITVLAGLLFVPQLLTAQSNKGCPENPDKQYNRQQILEKFADIIYNAIPEQSRTPIKPSVINGQPVLFSVWDLTDTSNKAELWGDCVNFIDNHIYHFIEDNFPFSVSHIAILEDGKVKTFQSLSCPEGRDDYEELIKYLEVKLKKDKDKNDLITKVKNFRRYHYYPLTDILFYFCKEKILIKSNPDNLYDRLDVYQKFSRILYKFAPESYNRQIGVSVANDARAINFFVYDLTDPSNKQITSLERVDFINNHIYHFGYMDAPYSFSHIAILEDGELKVFSGLNCPKKGDSLSDVLKYINEKLKNDKKKDEIIERVKNYREYGVYTSFEGISTPQCDKLETE